MLINLLKQEVSINRYFEDKCEENGIGVDLDPTIEKDDVLIIKVDRYYNHLEQNPIKSPDCLVIQRCADNTYSITIIELRNIGSQNGFTVDEIVQKFNNCLDDFMSVRFGALFHNAMFNIRSIRLLFVSDPYGFKENPEKQNMLRGHKLDALIAQRIPRYFGKYLYIDPKVPNPSIRRCREN